PWCRGRRCRGRLGSCPWPASPWRPRWRSTARRRCRSSTPAAATSSAPPPSAGWSCSCCPRSAGAWPPLRPSTTSPASPPGSTGTTAAAAAVMTPPASPSSPSASSLPQPKVHLRPTHLLKRNLAIFLAFCLIDLCCVHAAGSVLDYRPSTVAAAAILAASYGALLTKEALESKMDNLSPSCPIEKVSCTN
uniref:Cyclin C-terminal domain-containing protein n=1 Tax=Aegilops tauschii subsp. strangulata TaxID=200361 RepID=A0A453JU78_AEGTS